MSWLEEQQRYLNLLGTLLDHTPTGLAVFDTDQRLLYANLTWVDFVESSMPLSASPGAAGLGAQTDSLFARVLAGKTVRSKSVHVTMGEHESSYWEVAWSPITVAGEVVAAVNVVQERLQPGDLDMVVHEVQEIARAEAAIQRRFAFEKLITSISSRFINLPSNKIDQGIDETLQLMGEFDGADRSYVFQYVGEFTHMDNTHEWCAPGIESQRHRLRHVPSESLPWVHQMFLNKQVLHVPSVVDLPPEAGLERREFIAQGIKSLLVVPMIYQDAVIGFLGFDAVRSRRYWSEESISLLRIVGEIVANALAHHRSQIIQQGQQRLLELLATGADFSDVLHALVRMFEEEWPGMFASVMLVDDQSRRLQYGAARGLPRAYLDGFEGAEIGPNMGSCAAAAYWGRRVVAKDIAADPTWSGLRDLALEHGLLSCWSEPVFSGGRVAATFAMYYRQSRAPTEAELQSSATAAHVVSVAIEQRQAQQALQETQRALTTLMSNLPGMAYRSRPDRLWAMSLVSEGCEELTGFEPADLINSKTVGYADLIHAEDRDFVRAEVQQALVSDQPFQLTYRIQTAAGKVKWVWEKGRGVQDGSGELVAMEGFITDITERMMAEQMLEQRVADRTRELSALYEVTAVASESLQLDQILARSLRQVLHAMQATIGLIQLRDPARQVLHLVAYEGFAEGMAAELQELPEHSSLTGSIANSGEPLVVPDVSQEPRAHYAVRMARWKCFAGVPMRARGRVLGVLSVVSTGSRQFNVEEVALLASIGDQIGIAVENARLYEQAQVTAKLEERQRLARDLHDSVTQSLYSVTLFAEASRRLMQTGRWEQVTGYLQQLGATGQQALKEMRLLVYELRPPILETEGLIGALQHRLEAVERRAGVETRLFVQTQVRLSIEIEQELYSIAMEALNNALKHARASSTSISIGVLDDLLQMEVADNGIGFDLEEASQSGGMGLNTMRERAAKVGAALEVHSQAGLGTQVAVSLPLEPETLAT